MVVGPPFGFFWLGGGGMGLGIFEQRVGKGGKVIGEKKIKRLC